MQELLRLANAISEKSLYLDLLRRSGEAAGEIGIEHEERLGQLAALGEAMTYSPLERQIIATLRDVVPSAALSYEQALIDLAAASRLSYAARRMN